MSTAPFGPHQATASELRERIAAERRGLPFLVYRDSDGAQRVVELPEGIERVSLGRASECDVSLDWDPQVSRLHAELVRLGPGWVVCDDGLSRNGTFVHGDRVPGRRRLADSDVIRLGATSIAYRQPGDATSATTRLPDDGAELARITTAQRRVLVALCRPFKADATHPAPASNASIADELVLTVAAVKTHLRALYAAFGIEDAPQVEKRHRLVALAFTSGLISDRDL